MKINKIVLTGILLTILTAVILGFKITQGGNIPKGWFQAGSSPDSYEFGVQNGAGQNGSNAAYIKSIKNDIKGFGTLMQYFVADKYLGKRVRLSGYLSSKDVVNSAGFWMRIDGKENPSQPLSFDNMGNRPVTGTTEFKLYQVVLDVPSGSSMINYGALLAGTGEIKFCNLKFEVVDKSVPTTDINSNKPVDPVNLNFTE